jgi:hypothetical protein
MEGMQNFVWEILRESLKSQNLDLSVLGFEDRLQMGLLILVLLS